VAGTRQAGRRGGAVVSRAGGPEPVLAGATAAAGAAVSGVVLVAAVVLVAWATDSRTGASARDALRTAVDAWLLAHRGVLRLPSGTVAAVPLGLTALPAVLLHRAGVSVARSLGIADLAAAARAVAALAAGYAALAAGLARLAATPTVAVGPLSAGIGAAVLATVAAGVGIVRAARLGPALVDLLPPAAMAVARAATAAVAMLLAAGAALVVLGLATHAGRATGLIRALDAGLVGGAVLLLVDVLLAPNAVVWGAGYAAGPGFAVGAGTVVSPFGSALGPVPALPLLAALPQGDGAPPALRAVLVAPVAAGVLAGVLVRRRLPPGTPPRWAAVAGAATGPAAGAALAVLAALAGGSVGGGYLTAVGPSPWQVGVAIMVEVGAPAALAAALLPARRTGAGLGAGEGAGR
jgi:hypothetical protein